MSDKLENRIVFGIFLVGAVIGTALVVRNSKHEEPNNERTLQTEILGKGKNFRTISLDGGMRDMKIYSEPNGNISIKLRDLQECRKFNDDSHPCRATEWLITGSGKFVSREIYSFNHGLKMWTGQLITLGTESTSYQSSYGIGNPIPYYLHVVRPQGGRYYSLQKQLTDILKEIPPAA